MASIRVGLKEFSSNSTNSPSIKILNAKKTNATAGLIEGKVSAAEHAMCCCVFACHFAGFRTKLM